MFKIFSIYWKKYSGARKILIFPRIVKDLPRLRRFLEELREFKNLGGNVDEWSIHLHEDEDFAGFASGHYFWQDLIVAKWVLGQRKKQVADVGSRIDGYVGHVASTSKIFVLDIRPIKKAIPNVEFIETDILSYKNTRRFEIVTSLHTIEHVGLGRYGDAINPTGHVKAFAALANLTLPQGHLVVSFPIDAQTRVEFNGQRMIGFLEPINWARENDLTFKKFICLLGNDEIVSFRTVSNLEKFMPERGALGIYFFKKKS